MEKFLLFLTVRDLVFCIFTYIVYILVKLPINSLIYSERDSFISFLIALMISLIITMLKNKLFSHLFKKIKHDYILNGYLLEALVFFYTIITYKFYIIYYHGHMSTNPNNHFGTMPEISDEMKKQLFERRMFLKRQHNQCVRIINKLEPVASAMERDGSDSKHGALADVFREQVRDAKDELDEIYAPI